MKHRNIMGIIFLSIITFGIYDLYWLVKTKKELNARTTIHTPSIWLLFAPIGILLLAVVFMLLLPHDVDGAASTVTNLIAIIVELLAVLAIIPLTFYWFYKFSKAVSQYTHGELNTAMTFILLWVLRFVGLAVVQDKFNDMLAAGSVGGQSAAASFTPPVAASPAVMPDATAAPVTLTSGSVMPLTQPAVTPSSPESSNPPQPTPPANPIG